MTDEMVIKVDERDVETGKSNGFEGLHNSAACYDENKALFSLPNKSKRHTRIANGVGSATFVNQVVSSILLLYIGYDSGGRLINKSSWLAKGIYGIKMTKGEFQIIVSLLAFTGALTFGGTAGFHNAKSIMLEGLPKKHKKSIYSALPITLLSGAQNSYFMWVYPNQYQHVAFVAARWFAKHNGYFVGSALVAPWVANKRFIELEWRRTLLAMNYYPIKEILLDAKTSAVNILSGRSEYQPILSSDSHSEGIINGTARLSSVPQLRKFAYYAILSLRSVLEITKSEALNKKIVKEIFATDKSDDEIVSGLVALFCDEASKMINTHDFTWSKTIFREFGKFIGYLTTVSSWGPGFAAGKALGDAMGMPNLATALLFAIPVGLANCYSQGSITKNTISAMFVSLYNKLFLPTYHSAASSVLSKTKVSSSCANIAGLGWTSGKAVFASFVITAFGVMNFGIALAFPTFASLGWLNDVFAGANGLGNSANALWGFANSAFKHPFKNTLDRLDEWLIATGDLHNTQVLTDIDGLKQLLKVPTNDELGLNSKEDKSRCIDSIPCCN